MYLPTYIALRVCACIIHLLKCICVHYLSTYLYNCTSIIYLLISKYILAYVSIYLKSPIWGHVTFPTWAAVKVWFFASFVFLTSHRSRMLQGFISHHRMELLLPREKTQTHTTFSVAWTLSVTLCTTSMTHPWWLSSTGDYVMASEKNFVPLS